MTHLEQQEFLICAVELAERAELSAAHDVRLRALVFLLRTGLERVMAENPPRGDLRESAGVADYVTLETIPL